MIISIVNQSTVKSDDEVQQAIRVVNRQIAEDVAPYWGLTATLRLDGTGRGGAIRDVRGDALLRLRDEVQSDHDVGTAGVPEGVVFTQLEQLVKKSVPWLTWTVALSHEAIELLLDPWVNTLVRGPHPESKRSVFYYREVCDPVQSEIYTLDGLPVSNFVLPAYYGPGTKKNSDTNFLGTPMRPFGFLKQGNVGFWDPQKGARGGYVMWPAFGSDDVHHAVVKYKKRMNAARIVRYSQHGEDGRRR
ncbi:MAG: hypothetical protein ACKVS7_13300 [Gemmatimonadaceae bacterium]